MAMILPGMDPYLENPQVFPGIHGPMAVYLRDQLTPRIRPRYVASVGERVYVEGLGAASNRTRCLDPAVEPRGWESGSTRSRRSGRTCVD
jgi:hypothetical protein